MRQAAQADRTVEGLVWPETGILVDLDRLEKA
jgi:hypothetical protein